MKVFLYIDESGSIHKNSRTKYFAVGGYFVLEEDNNRVKSLYKRLNLSVKRRRNIPLDKEVKSYDYLSSEKAEIFNAIQDIDTFVGCVKVFDKTLMMKKIEDCNVFYNYAVQVLIKDCVLPFLNSNYDEDYEFIISADNRDTGVKNLKDLEKYLITNYCMTNHQFNIKYYDSASNYGVQLADLIVNTFYNKYKNIEIVKEVIPHIKDKNFIVSKFPGTGNIFH